MLLIRFPVHFFKSGSGSEPVRDWLKSLDPQDRKIIGEDIKTVQVGWPVGMPLVRKLKPDLWEVRSRLQGRIARVLFTFEDGKIVLVHGFIKKTQNIPLQDLFIAESRISEIRGRK
ncbi:MAG: type II toxin-antitoxin system RelE/ParE family toxin [Magnetococcales bacterium]|nr:type II toxin-antitoxin system RelE/ParE family toxin [Magnetococcales bacterium]